MHLGYFMVILVSTQVDASSYVVTFPNALIPGVDLDVRVVALKANGIVNVLVELQHANQSVITSAHGQVSAGVPGVIRLAVLDDLPDSTYKIVLSGSGGLDFRNESGIRYEKNNLLTLIQTDKTRYSGGQEVKYRAILLRPNMLGYKGPVTLTVYDGDDNKIEVTKYNTTKDGVISGSLLLSREPVFGVWTIHVQAMGKSYEKVFEVNDYVLPKFQVDIKLPDHIMDIDNSFEVSVSARFTFKSDVYGNCTVQIYNVHSTTHYVEYERKIVGVVNITVPMSDLKSKLQMDSKINVRALVTDNATALTMANEKGLEIKSYKNEVPIIVTKVDSRDHFIPGLSYQTPILVAQNGEPVTSTGFVRVTPTVIEAQEMPCIQNSPPTKWLKIETSVKSAFTIPIDEHGYGVLNYPISVHTNRIDFKLSYEIEAGSITLHSVSNVPTTLIGLSAEKAVTFFSYMSDRIVMVRSLHNVKKQENGSKMTSEQVGEKVRITAESTQSLRGTVSFEVYSRGMLLENKIVRPNNETRFHVDIDVTADMVPQMYVTATHVTERGQLIHNYVVLVVDGFPYRNKVNVTYNTTSLQPKDGVQMVLTADPNSTVYILVEDETNRLLGTENDIFASEVVEQISPSGNDTRKNTRSVDANSLRPAKRTITSAGSINDGMKTVILADFDAFEKTAVDNLLIYNKGLLPTECSSSVFSGTSAVYTTTTTPSPITQTYLNQHGYTYASSFGWEGANYGGCRIQKRSLYDIYCFTPTGPASLVSPPPSNEHQWSQGPGPGTGSAVQQQSLELKEIVRRKFPETWLWEEHDLGTSGKLTLEKNVPDSLTTWVTSAFATNKISGFGLSEIKQKITTRKNFFLTMALPQSIVHGEEFLLQITIFNYLTTRQQVEKDQGHSAYVRISPKTIGTLKITVFAKAGTFFKATAIDKLEKQVTVRPQGVKRTMNQQRLVTVNSNGQTYTDKVDLHDSPYMIPNTRSIHAKISGDIMVPTIKGLQDLIELPHGCGEQVMVNFAPNVYLAKYMKSTGQLSKDVEKKALSYIRSGYQQELQYKRLDGSFSIWGNSDTHGSTWLTSYVLKCFHQARELIMIDENVLSKAVTWLMNKQTSDGSFIEQYQVYYVDHRHSEVGLKLTAFTVISLLEARNDQQTSIDQLNSVVAKGTHHLESKLNGITDAYTLSIVCYALAKAGSTSGQSCFTKLERCKHSAGDMIYWTETTSVSRRELFKRNLGTRAPARDIETTAYALLVYHTLGRHAEALPIVKWIVSQRNPKGGFQTTQDTVISIQALTEFSQMLPRKNPNDNVNFHLSGPGFTHRYTSSQSNHDLLHTQEIPLQVDTMDIKATGHGMAILDVVQTFYVAHLESNVNINVSATIQKETLNSITVRPIVSWKGQSKSSMLIVAVELPTGFIVDEEFLKKQSLIRRHETNGRNVDLYFNGIDPQKQIHVDVKMDRSDPVVGTQACHITAYDYYEPEKHAMTRYESGVLKRANICDVCPSCNMCTGSGTFNQIGIGR